MRVPAGQPAARARRCQLRIPRRDPAAAADRRFDGDRPCVFRGRHPRRGVFLRRAGGAQPDRDRHTRRAVPPHRPGRRDHRRVRRKLHRACLRPVRQQALRRLRAPVPEARRAGRSRRARALAARLAGARLRRVRALRARRAALRRDPVRRRDVRRPRPEGRTVHPGHGHRHFDRLAPRVRADRLRPHLLRPRQVSALAGGGRLVGRPARAVAGDARQLRRPVRVQVRELDPRDRRFRDGVAAGRPRREALSRDEVVRGQREPALPSSRRRRRVRQPRHAGAAGGAGERRGGPPGEIPRGREADRRARRQFAVAAGGRLGPERAPAEQRRNPDQGGRRADRPLFVRSGRAPEGPHRALADGAGDPRVQRVRRRQQPAARARRGRSGHRRVSDRRQLRRRSGRRRARLSQRSSDVVRAAAGGGRPPARVGVAHPVGVARFPAADDDAARGGPVPPKPPEAPAK